MRVKKISSQDCDPWLQTTEQVFRPDRRFFSLAKSGDGYWILQPEIGLLGSLFRKSSNGYETLIQHKEEPGNKPLSQIAPSVQATASNMDRVHGGKNQLYLDFFYSNLGDAIISESLNSEQGLRFWRKRNLNKSIEVSESIDVHENYEWLSIPDFSSTLKQDLKVNTDLRSVIATSNWSRLLGLGALNENYNPVPAQEDLEQARAKLAAAVQKSGQVKKSNNNDAESRRRDDDCLINVPRDCQIGFFEISDANREVDSWKQPLIMDSKQSEFELVCISDGIKNWTLLRITDEVGLYHGAEWGPTWSQDRTLARNDLGVQLKESSVELLSILQTDEGGRFFEVFSRYTLSQIFLSPDELNDIRTRVDNDPRFVLIDLLSLNSLCSSGMSTTNELRTLASIVFAKIVDGELR